MYCFLIEEAVLVKKEFRDFSVEVFRVFTYSKYSRREM